MYLSDTWAKVFLFQTLSDQISQLFSPLTSLARSGMLVEFWTRLTFFRKMRFRSESAETFIQNTLGKGPLFGQMENRKGSFRDVTWRGRVGTWRLIRDWSYLLTFRAIVLFERQNWHGGAYSGEHTWGHVSAQQFYKY